MWTSALVNLVYQNLHLSLSLEVTHRLVFDFLRAFLATLSIFLIRDWIDKHVLLLTFFYWLLSPSLILADRLTWLDQLFTWLFFFGIVLWIRYLKVQTNKL